MTFDEANYAKLVDRFSHFRMDAEIDVAEVKALLKDCIYLEDESTTIEGQRLLLGYACS